MDKSKQGNLFYSRAGRDPIFRKQKRKRLRIKRVTVKNTYYSLHKIIKDFKIPCVKNTSGKQIVHVYCRSVVQLDNIPFIMKELLKHGLIEEIGMPMEYSYKFMNLKLFLKPVDNESSKKLVRVFQNFWCKYHYNVTDIQSRHVARRTITEKSTSLKNITPTDYVSMIIILVTIVSILLTAALSRN